MQVNIAFQLYLINFFDFKNFLKKVSNNIILKRFKPVNLTSHFDCLQQLWEYFVDVNLHLNNINVFYKDFKNFYDKPWCLWWWEVNVNYINDTNMMNIFGLFSRLSWWWKQYTKNTFKKINSKLLLVINFNLVCNYCNSFASVVSYAWILIY